MRFVNFFPYKTLICSLIHQSTDCGTQGDVVFTAYNLIEEDPLAQKHVLKISLYANGYLMGLVECRAVAKYADRFCGTFTYARLYHTGRQYAGGKAL